MDDRVFTWLTTHELGQYFEAFKEHRIDFSMLTALTEADLIALGIVAIGDRKRFFNAVEDLHAETPSGMAEDAGRWSDDDVVQRRQLTILFCDLVGSTELAEQWDPEELRNIFKEFLSAVDAEVERFGGHSAQHRGDAVLAYFGWPTAKDSDAERAVRAALSIVERTSKLNIKPPLSARIGIETGLVVIGESVYGSSAHIAARLQEVAKPGSVVVSEQTADLLGAGFLLNDLGLQNLKGIKEEVRAFEVDLRQESRTRLEDRILERLTPFVGRGAELSLLHDRWRLAKSGEGQLVLLSGVPGIGKSRLVLELESQIRGEDFSRVYYQGSPFYSESAFFPIAQQLSRYFSLSPQSSRDEIKESLTDQLQSRITCSENDIEYLVDLILPSATSSDRLYDPKSRAFKNSILATVFTLLMHLIERAPLLIVIEDLQWIDASTHEVIDRVTHELHNNSILVVATFRNDYQPAVSSRRNVSQLTLSGMSNADAAITVKNSVGFYSGTGVLVEKIVERAEGIPLYLEELARSVFNDGAQSNSRTDIRDYGSSITQIPSSLRESLMSRLDKFPAGRELTQMSSVIGREFSTELLELAFGFQGRDLDRTLKSLTDHDVVYPVDGGRSYAFKHALLRDTAYGTMTMAKLRNAHDKVARALTTKFPDVHASRPELIAHHLDLAGKQTQAMAYWKKAGNIAISRSAGVEAIKHLQNALKSCQIGVPSEAKAGEELQIQLLMGVPLIATKGYHAPETEQAFQRALHLSRELERTKEEIQALFGLWGHHWIGGMNDQAEALAEEIVARSAISKDRIAEIVAQRVMGSTCFTKGDLRKAEGHFQKTIKLSEPEGGGALSGSYMIEPKFAAMLLGAWCQWYSGDIDNATIKGDEALEFATSLNHPYSIAFSNYVLSAIYLQRGEIEEAKEHAQTSLELSTEHQFTLYKTYAEFSLGCVAGEEGKYDDAIAAIEDAIDVASHKQTCFKRSMMLAWLAKVQADKGQVGTALGTLQQAKDDIRRFGDRLWEAEVFRMTGELLLISKSGSPASALKHFEHAIATSRHQTAKSLELRAAISYARWHNEFGERSRGIAMLRRAYDPFENRSETSDVIAAKELLFY